MLLAQTTLLLFWEVFVQCTRRGTYGEDALSPMTMKLMNKHWDSFMIMLWLSMSNNSSSWCLLADMNWYHSARCPIGQLTDFTCVISETRWFRQVEAGNILRRNIRTKLQLLPQLTLPPLYEDCNSAICVSMCLFFCFFVKAPWRLPHNVTAAQWCL